MSSSSGLAKARDSFRMSQIRSGAVVLTAIVGGLEIVRDTGTFYYTWVIAAYVLLEGVHGTWKWFHRDPPAH